MEPSTRKVLTRSPARAIHVINNPHFQDEPIEAESTLERDFVYLATLYPFTKSIRHQPFCLTWSQGTYTPDFLVQFANGEKTVVEVKPLSKVQAYDDLIKSVREQLRTAGYRFLVVNEQMLRRDGVAFTARLLMRYAKSFVEPRHEVRCLEMVRSSAGGISIGKLVARGIPHFCVAHLIACRKVRINSLKSLDDAILYPVTDYLRAEEQDHALQFESWFGA